MTESQREWIDERAGIIEHEGLEERETAEREAERLWPKWEADHG